jgi:hypothetical protein
LCDKVCQGLATGQWFSLVSSTNKIDCHDIAEILLKVVLNTCSVDHVSLQEQERIKVEFTHEELYAFYNQVSFCH